MKRIIIVICVYGLLIIPEGCKKNASQQNYYNSIEGIWELRQISGQAGVKNYEPGNGNLIYFSANSFQKYDSVAVRDSGIYQLVHDISASENVCLVLAKGQYETRIKFNNIEQPKQFIQISNDSLYFISGCFANDAGSSQVYVRQSYIF